MKFFFVVVSIALMAFTCRKSGETSNAQDNQLTGKWKHFASWMNPGAGPDIESPATGDQFVEFGNDGTFRSNMSAYDYDSYNVDSTHRLTLTKSSSGDNLKIVYTVVADTLRMARLDCVESCGNGFVPYK